MLKIDDYKGYTFHFKSMGVVVLQGEKYIGFFDTLEEAFLFLNIEEMNEKIISIEEFSDENVQTSFETAGLVLILLMYLLLILH